MDCLARDIRRAADLDVEGVCFDSIARVAMGYSDLRIEDAGRFRPSSLTCHQGSV
jgi:hypothetical protein